MVKSLARFALVAMIGGALWSLRRQSALLAVETPKPRQPAEQTWEGEGGALPATGSQMGPEPVLPVSTETSSTY